MVTAEPLQPLSATATDEERAARYKLILQRLQLILEDETDWTARMATAVAELHASMGYFSWTGFYQVDPLKATELVIGPYQGPLACLRIPFARGVCGAAATSRSPQLVPDVDAFPGHIACSSSTRSEAVIPVFGASDGSPLVAVLDVDSNELAAFTDADVSGLMQVCDWLGAALTT